MSMPYRFHDQINLHVRDRISETDARRQAKTAQEILRRFEEQPGVVLADEVGMGKTFVALAVATSVALADPGHRPVVVMVPSSLREKWPSDFSLFGEKCLPPDLAKRVCYGTAERTVAFLKQLDDPVERRKSVLFITHGAMSRGLMDPFAKLALIQRALHHRRDAKRLRSALGRCMGTLLRCEWMSNRDPDLWETLLRCPPGRWAEVLQRRGNPYVADEEGVVDDPVPEPVLPVLEELDLSELYEALQKIPLRQSSSYEARLVAARRSINACLREVWRDCLRQTRFRLPLLILDEAHHLKNARTRLASLFQSEEAREDAEEVTRGPFGGVFERMLFLTATPFQLGHHELCSVLERFDGISWRGRSAPPRGRQVFKGQLESLRQALDSAQEAAVGLDAAWGSLRPEDLGTADVESWWRLIRQQRNGEQNTASNVLSAYERTERRMCDAQAALKPWVIRHLKPKTLPEEHAGVPRRTRYSGAAILHNEDGSSHHGLMVDDESLLPFLLAARLTACTPESRPVFAEGLASSFEAFLQTRRINRSADKSATDDDDDPTGAIEISDTGRWYLDHLSELLPSGEDPGTEEHPKVAATVERAVQIWRQNEKLVVFCHYIATGRLLRKRISDAVDQAIREMACQKLNCTETEVADHLQRLGDRFFDDSPIRRAADAAVRDFLAEFPQLSPLEADLIEIVRRNLRTPSTLVRYFPLHDRLDADSLAQAMETADESGLTLRQLLSGFFEFLQNRCGEVERDRFINAMKLIQTGTHSGAEAARSFAEDELQGERVDRLLPNVRLVNGTTRQETRQRLMLAFNTPFSPDILVASSVMAEGVDLHLSCRHIIHHDLCWNPSTLEQRTGRIDRIGAKVERCGQPIRVYLPYIAETQDEKMYRVVMDRERWFSVVMGEQYKLDARTTDRLAERVPLPESLAESLRFHLEVK